MLPVISISVNGIADDLRRQYPLTQERLNKARALIQDQRIWFYDHTESGEPVYRCKSSDGSAVYTVSAGECSCPSRRLCYHRLARGILVILSANKTAVAFGDALALEEQEPPAPTPQAPPVSQDPRFYSGPAFTPTKPVKRVQSAGRMSPSLTIRNSMDRLGRRIVEVFTARPAGAKLH